ncbi:MAG: sugar nucleotide-binding protein [Methylocella sp.]
MRAIVIGTDGLIGSALAKALRARGDSVVGTTRRDKGAAPNDLFLDLADPSESGALLPEADVCFLCAAMTNFADCRARPDLARMTDVLTPAKIAARLAGTGVRTILLSTSAVLDCKEPGMSAERARAPASLYGRFKAEAEEAVLKHGELGAVVRLTKVLTPDMRLMGDWIATLRAGREIAAIRDLRIAPLTLRHVVSALVAVADAGAGGIWQISGASDIAYDGVARYLATRLGLSTSLVRSITAAERGLPAEDVTAYTSLDCARLRAAAGFVPPEPEAVIDEVFGHMLRPAL